MNSFNYALIFLLVFSFVFFLLWYWVVFRGGAEHWEKGILKIHGDKYRIVAHPMVAKVFSTLLLISFLFALVLLFIDPTFN